MISIRLQENKFSEEVLSEDDELEFSLDSLFEVLLEDSIVFFNVGPKSQLSKTMKNTYRMNSSL
jgi:hypothetical protein